MRNSKQPRRNSTEQSENAERTVHAYDRDLQHWQGALQKHRPCQICGLYVYKTAEKSSQCHEKRSPG